jgi:transposase InsO family protein
LCSVPLPDHGVNLNAYAERFVRSIKSECLDRLVLFGEQSLRHVVTEYVEHYHRERNHQGIGNIIPFPDARQSSTRQKVERSERLGGLLSFYHREAA